MTWGAAIIGLGNILDTLDDVQMRFDDNVVYVVGTNVEYAVYQEFGTSKMDAQPYLFPAAREVQRQLPKLAANKDSLHAVIKAAALEIERRAKHRVPVDTGNLKNSIKAERVQ